MHTDGNTNDSARSSSNGSFGTFFEMKHATTSITFTMQRSKLNVVSVIVITRPSDVSSARCGATFCVQPLAFLCFVGILYSCLNLN